MSRAEVEIAVDWAAAEGWNPGHADADCFHAQDPTGFLVGRLGDEPVSVISAVKYGDAFGFIGFYIVKPGFRGQGHGIAIWHEAMRTLAGRCIGLDGVVDQQPNYRKSGFALAYRNVRYQGVGTGEARDDRDLKAHEAMPPELLHRYDREHFGTSRPRFFDRWLSAPGHRVAGVAEDGRLAGLAVLRPCRSGHKVGPLFADSPAIAERLFTHLRGHVPAGAPIFLDIPEPNPEALALVRRHGMSPVFETARMYANGRPELPLARIYGVTTFELG
jgi:ribosomal protein S18 acetylase RimI-like enzyme